MPGTRSLLSVGLALLSACTAAVESGQPASTREPESTPRFVQRPAEVEGFVEATLPPDWRLGFMPAGTTPLVDGLGLALQREGLFVGNERLVAGVDGRLDPTAIEAHLILALDERLQTLAPALAQAAESNGEVWLAHANLYLDPDMLVGDLVDVIYTLGRHGFSHYQFAVASAPGERVGEQVIGFGLAVSPPKYSKEPMPDGHELPRASMAVVLTEHGVRISRRSARAEHAPIELLAWDRQPMLELERLAAELAQADAMTGGQHGPTAAFMADPRLPIRTLLEAMNAASGRDCSFVDMWGFAGGDPSHCHFVERIVEAGSAPTPAPADPQKDVWGGLTDAAAPTDPRSRVRAMVRSHLDEVRVCYEIGLARDPQLGGRVETHFTIEVDGGISQAEISESTLDDPEVEACLVELIGTWRLDGGVPNRTQITYPFNLAPGE